MPRRAMKRLVRAVLLLTLAFAAAGPRAALAGPGEAGRGRRPARTARHGLAGVDFVVLIWFRRDDPLATFQYQAYDVRRGEYTEAVDDWIALMRQKYPHYLVRVHRVNLDRERGATEQLKVGSVIYRELLMAAAESGVILGAPLQIGPEPHAVQHPSARILTWPETPGAGGTTNINPPANTSPFPVPYPRPHP